jgi:hypothetical protein
MRAIATSSMRLSQADVVLICAILGAGAAAAIRVAPVLWLTAVVVAVLTFRASTRASAQTAVEPLPLSEFPPTIDEAVQDAVARLPGGDARHLLASVVREARPLFGRTATPFDASSDNDARREAGELVLASCDTALELARLDALLEARTAPGGSPMRGDESLLNRLSAARDLFATRLADAAVALTTLYAAGVEQGTPASDRVAELVVELRADAGARVAAKRELDELLNPNPRAT